MQRDGPVFVCQGRVGTRLEQQSHHFYAAIRAMASSRERGAASIAGDVRIGAALQQQLDDVDVPPPGRYMLGMFAVCWQTRWDLRLSPVGN